MKKILFFIISLFVCNCVYALEQLEQPSIMSNCEYDYCEVHINFDERTEELTILVNNELVAEFTSGEQSQSGFNVVSWGSIVAIYPFTEESRHMNISVECNADYYESSAYTYEVEIPAYNAIPLQLPQPVMILTESEDFVTLNISSDYNVGEEIYFRLSLGNGEFTEWMVYSDQYVFARPASYEDAVFVHVEAYTKANGYIESDVVTMDYVLAPRADTGTGNNPGDDPIIDPVNPGTDPVDPDIPVNPNEPVTPTNTGNTIVDDLSENKENPLTRDNIIIYFVLLLISGLFIIVLKKKKISY